MTHADIVAKLAAHRSLGSAPHAELEWLAAHGTPRSAPPGEVLNRKGELVSSLQIYFSGALSIHVDRGAGAHKLFEWHGGDVGGQLPFSRGARPPNDAIVEEELDLLALPVDCVPDMIRECPVVTATLVHAMLDRARAFNASDLRDEKLVSLGRLAAGLAHELNNPASAAARSASLLGESVEVAAVASAAVGVAGLSASQWSAVSALRERAAQPAPEEFRTALARADREETFAEWLGARGANESCAAPLSATALTIPDFDELAAAIPKGTLGTVFRWIAADCQLRQLAVEIQTATSRVHELVGSVKGFTYMDHAPTPEPVDVRRGISETLMMLGAQLRAKNVEVQLELPDDLPHAHAVGAELNQVWMNLLDNAIAAVDAGGHVVVRAMRERECVVVTVTDDGPGIPADIIGRIFDPFFTTKDVGKGTGLGLDIVRRILRRHAAGIDVQSQPGHTEFKVSVPVALGT